MACHLHPILCTRDAVTTCTPVTVFFPFGVRLGSKKKGGKEKGAWYQCISTIMYTGVSALQVMPSFLKSLARPPHGPVVEGVVINSWTNLLNVVNAVKQS